MTEYYHTKDEISAAARANVMRGEISVRRSERNVSYMKASVMGMVTAFGAVGFYQVLTSDHPVLAFMPALVSVYGGISCVSYILKAIRNNRAMTATENELQGLMASNTYMSAMGREV